MSRKYIAISLTMTTMPSTRRKIIITAKRAPLREIDNQTMSDQLHSYAIAPKTSTRIMSTMEFTIIRVDADTLPPNVCVVYSATYELGGFLGDEINGVVEVPLL